MRAPTHTIILRAPHAPASPRPPHPLTTCAHRRGFEESTSKVTGSPAARSCFACASNSMCTRLDLRMDEGECFIVGRGSRVKNFLGTCAPCGGACAPAWTCTRLCVVRVTFRIVRRTFVGVGRGWEGESRRCKLQGGRRWQVVARQRCATRVPTERGGRRGLHEGTAVHTGWCP